jgi:hypothetical protein
LIYISKSISTYPHTFLSTFYVNPLLSLHIQTYIYISGFIHIHPHTLIRFYPQLCFVHILIYFTCLNLSILFIFTSSFSLLFPCGMCLHIL